MRLLALVLLVACSGEDARTALIVNTLVDADRDLIALRPERVVEKYQAMSETPQAFLRGTAPLFYRDLTRTLGGAVSGAELVWLYGDPHLENVGTTFDAAGPLFDGIDFDATVEGPFGWDVRRAALGLAVAIHMAGRSVDATPALVEGWRMGGGPLRPADLGRIAADTLALGASRQGQEISRYTLDGRFVRAADMLEVPSPFKEGLESALREWSQTRRGGAIAPPAIRDAVQRLGSGIASLPNLRFWLLVDGDRILELKEERDPPQPIGWLGRGPLPPDNALRVVRGSAALLSSPEAEPDLGRVTLENVPFQVRAVSRARREIDVADLVADVASGNYGDADLIDLGRDLGRLLGAGHRRQVALPDLGDVQVDLPQLLLDYDLFRAALKRRGPLLGARL